MTYNVLSGTLSLYTTTRCDLIWHVISRSGVVISITNCYIRFTLLYFTLWNVVYIGAVNGVRCTDDINGRRHVQRVQRDDN